MLETTVDLQPSAPVNYQKEFAERFQETLDSARQLDARLYEATIIGGGYVGAMAALTLAKAGKKVALVEADRIGSGSSGISMGHVCAEFDIPEDIMARYVGPQIATHMQRIIKDSRTLLLQTIAEERISCGLHETYAHVHPGGTCTLVNDMGTFDPYPYVTGLTLAARRYGADIFEGACVTDIQSHASRHVLVTSKGELTAEYVLCAGSRKMTYVIPRLKHLRKRSLDVYVSNIITEPLPENILQSMFPGIAVDENLPLPFDYLLEGDYLYGTVRPDRRVVLGTGMRFDPAPSDADAVTIFQATCKVFPLLAQHPFTWAWNVHNKSIDVTADSLPNAGYVDDDPTLLYVNGLAGIGICLGTKMGHMAAQAILGGMNRQPEMARDFSVVQQIYHLPIPPMPWGTPAGRAVSRFIEKLHYTGKMRKIVRWAARILRPIERAIRVIKKKRA